MLIFFWQNFTFSYRSLYSYDCLNCLRPAFYSTKIQKNFSRFVWIQFRIRARDRTLLSQTKMKMKQLSLPPQTIFMRSSFKASEESFEFQLRYYRRNFTLAQLLTVNDFLRLGLAQQFSPFMDSMNRCLLICIENVMAGGLPDISWDHASTSLSCLSLQELHAWSSLRKKSNLQLTK